MPSSGVARRDLDEQVILTIDPDSSHDLDDRLSVQAAGTGGGLRLCVSISDVAACLCPEREGSQGLGNSIA